MNKQCSPSLKKSILKIKVYSAPPTLVKLTLSLFLKKFQHMHEKKKKTVPFPCTTSASECIEK